MAIVGACIGCRVVRMNAVQNISRESKGRVVIAGGSGFLGTSLATHLVGLGYDVAVLSRQPLNPRVKANWKHVIWDARTTGDWTAELDGAAGVVNLAGRTVDCIKTPDHQDEILRSRIEATRVLGAAMREIKSPPPHNYALGECGMAVVGKSELHCFLLPGKLNGT